MGLDRARVVAPVEGEAAERLPRLRVVRLGRHRRLERPPGALGLDGRDVPLAERAQEGGALRPRRGSPRQHGSHVAALSDHLGVEIGGEAGGPGGPHHVAPRGHELEVRVVVGVERDAAGKDPGVEGPPLELGAAHRPGGDEGRRVGEDAGRAQVAADAGIDERPLEPRPVRPLLLAAAHQQQVRGQVLRPHLGPHRWGEPERDVGEDGQERRHLHLHVRGLEAVVVEPLREEAAGGEAREGRLVELAGEEVRDARDPRVRRLGGDDVPAPAGAQDVVAGVAEGDREAGVAAERAGERREEGRRLEGGALDLDALDRLERVEGGGGGARPRPPPDHERAPRPGVEQERHVGHEPLLRDVEGRAARVRLAVDGEEAPVAAPRGLHRHHGLRALAVEQQVPLLAQPRPEPQRRVDPVDPLEAVAVDARGREDRVPRRPLGREGEARGGGSDERAHLDRPPGPRRGREGGGPAREQQAREDEVRGLEAEPLDEDEVGGEGAGDRPRGVPGIELPGGLLRPRRAGAREVQEEREAEPEGERHGQHRDQAEQEGGGLVRGERDREDGEGEEVRDRQHPDRPLPGEHREARAHEEQADGPCRAGDALAHAAVDERARGDAEEHGEEHRVERVDGGADHEHERARPEDLDAERGGTRGDGEDGAEGGAGDLDDRDRRSRGDGLARRHRALGRPAPGHRADEEARRRRGHQRAAHAERRDEDERGEGDAEGAPERVEQVQAAEAGVHVPPRSLEVLHGEGHGHPEQDRGGQDDGRGEHRDSRGLEGTREAGAGDHEPVRPRQRPQERQREEGEGSHRHLRPRVGPQRIGRRAAGGEGAPEGEPAHEDGEDHRHRRGRAAEDEGERPHPQRLVDEGGGPGEGDEERQGAGGARGRGLGLRGVHLEAAI